MNRIIRYRSFQSGIARGMILSSALALMSFILLIRLQVQAVTMSLIDYEAPKFSWLPADLPPRGTLIVRKKLEAQQVEVRLEVKKESQIKITKAEHIDQDGRIGIISLYKDPEGTFEFTFPRKSLSSKLILMVKEKGAKEYGDQSEISVNVVEPILPRDKEKQRLLIEIKQVKIEKQQFFEEAQKLRNKALKLYFTLIILSLALIFISILFFYSRQKNKQLDQLHETCEKINLKIEKIEADLRNEKLGPQLTEIESSIKNHQELLIKNVKCDIVSKIKTILSDDLEFLQQVKQGIEQVSNMLLPPLKSNNSQERRDKLKDAYKTFIEFNEHLRTMGSLFKHNKSNFDHARSERIESIIKQIEDRLRDLQEPQNIPSQNPTQKLLYHLCSPQISTNRPQESFESLVRQTQLPALRDLVRFFSGFVDEEIRKGNEDKDKINKEFEHLIKQVGYRELRPMKGDRYDPREHHPEGEEPSDLPRGLVVRTIRRGFATETEVIQKSRVIISK